MLTAIAVDGNNQLLPVTFAFVESENTDSWYWFLERVKLAVVRNREDVCLLYCNILVFITIERYF
jgi:hypothetical protein